MLREAILELQKKNNSSPCGAVAPERSTNNLNPACNKGGDPCKAAEKSLVKGSPGKVR